MKPLDISKFRVESYQEEKGRCFGCVQENCGFDPCSCSCHTATTIKWRIWKGDFLVSAGLNIKPVLSKYLESHFGDDVIQMHCKRFEDERDKLEQEYNDKWFDLEKRYGEKMSKIEKVRS